MRNTYELPQWVAWVRTGLTSKQRIFTADWKTTSRGARPEGVGHLPGTSYSKCLKPSTAWSNRYTRMVWQTQCPCRTLLAGNVWPICFHWRRHCHCCLRQRYRGGPLPGYHRQLQSHTLKQIQVCQYGSLLILSVSWSPLDGCLDFDIARRLRGTRTPSIRHVQLWWSPYIYGSKFLSESRTRWQRPCWSLNVPVSGWFRQLPRDWQQNWPGLSYCHDVNFQRKTNGMSPVQGQRSSSLHQANLQLSHILSSKALASKAEYVLECFAQSGSGQLEVFQTLNSTAKRIACCMVIKTAI